MTLIRKIWPVVRLLVFLAAGLFCTVFIDPDDIGTLKNYLGYILLTFAVFDVFIIIIIPFFKKPGSGRVL